MPNIKVTGVKSEINYDLKNKRKQIIEEERIRVLGDALMLFYDKLMDKYLLIHPQDEEDEGEEIQPVTREEVEEFAREYAQTKPLGF